LFYDWFDARSYEQTLRVDGIRQRDIVISGAGYPDPWAGGEVTVHSASRFETSQELGMPMTGRASASIEQQISRNVQVILTGAGTRGWRQLRGRDVNAPIAVGVRPSPDFGAIVRVESTARSASRSFGITVHSVVPARQTFLAVNYTWSRSWNEADGPFSLPASSLDPRADQGPSSDDVRHRLAGLFSSRIWRSLRVGLTVLGSSAPPYTVTTGYDDNGDAVINDRPPGVGRNSARGAARFEVAGRASWSVGIGPRRAQGSEGSRRFRLDVSLSVQNLLNRTNPVGFCGVLGSPLFGKPMAALPARRAEVGARVGF